jgi:transposase
MKIAGYVPRLDIPVDFTIEYNYKKEYFKFEISVYGVYVGKRKSEWIIGVNETEVLTAPLNKSSEYLSESA